jgi:hypothetical protein
MFQVETDRVMFATGAPKPADQAKAGRKLRKSIRARAKLTTPQKVGKKAKKTLRKEKYVEAKEKAASGAEDPASGGWLSIEEIRAQRKEEFNSLLIRLDNALDERKNFSKAKRKQELRALRKEVLENMRGINKKTAKTLDDALNSLLARMSISLPTPEQQAEASAEAEAAEQEIKAKEPTPEYVQALREAMVRARENPVDESKPYATPWKPRPYMSAFAFIPRYLEVNHNICAAVYLRHPVARPNLAEVP